MMTGFILSLVLFGEGFLTGITLTAMLGPVTMIILKYGIQVNRSAGVWAASGTWVSDFVFIAATYWLTASLAALVEQPEIKLWIYIVGGCGLLMMGILMTRIKRNPAVAETLVGNVGYTRAFLSGFLVNSLSPFTLFFWIGAAVFLRMQSENPVWYYGGLMLSLAIGDFMKAWIAPKITRWIKEKYVYWVQVLAGVVIALTGIYMLGYGALNWWG